MCQPGAEQVALVVEEDLGFIFEPAERRRVDDAVAVALEFAARAGRAFGMATPARLRGMRRIRCEVGVEVDHRAGSPTLACKVASSSSRGALPMLGLPSGLTRMNLIAPPSF